MTASSTKTYVVVRSDASQIEVQADRAEAPDASRVTFYKEDEVVAAFIGYSAFYVKP